MLNDVQQAQAVMDTTSCWCGPAILQHKMVRSHYVSDGPMLSLDWSEAMVYFWGEWGQALKRKKILTVQNNLAHSFKVFLYKLFRKLTETTIVSVEGQFIVFFPAEC